MTFDWLRKYNLLSFEEIDSTNSEALRMARVGVSDDFVIHSIIQTGGRGTKGRYWSSARGNLHLSILLNVDFDIARAPQLSFVIANAVYEAIDSLAKEQNIDIDLKLKWPNDVLANSAKIAGILLESIQINKKNYIIIGIGVNIDIAPKTDKPTICLKDLGIKVDNTEFFLNILMNRFEKLYSEWQENGSFIQVRRDWLSRAYNLDKIIVIDDGNKKISGIFKTIELDGSICLKLENGQHHNFMSGEVLFKKNA